MRAMAANVSCASLADCPRLVDKADAQGTIWHYFACVTNSQGNPMDTKKPPWKRCFKATQSKGAKTLNLAKHLTDRCAHFFKEFKGQQVG